MEDIITAEAMRILTPRPQNRKLADITNEALFSGLFEVQTTTLDKIKKSMETNGYNPAWPLSCWRKSEAELVLLDGHTRFKAASDLGIEEAPVVEFKFIDEDAALEYAIHCQESRRNLSPAAFVEYLQRVEKRKNGDTGNLKQGANSPSGSIDPLGKTIAELAEITGKSETLVKRALKVVKEAKPEIVEKMKSGEMSVNAAVQTVTPPKPEVVKEPEAVKEPEPPVPAPAYSPAPAAQYTYDSIVARWTEQGVEWLLAKLQGYLSLQGQDKIDEHNRADEARLAADKARQAQSK